MAGTANEVDEIIRSWISDNQTVVGYVVINAEGIPIKYHEKMPYEKAVQYAALLSDGSRIWIYLLQLGGMHPYSKNSKHSNQQIYESFCMKSRQAVRELLPNDNEPCSVRLRTAQGTEIIAVQSNGYTLIALQNCTGKPYDYGEESVEQKEQEWEEA